MTYYNLTTLGHSWLNNQAPDPAKHLKVLEALAYLIEENDVSRTSDQIARSAELLEEDTTKGLKYLVGKNYIKTSKQPLASEETLEAHPQIKRRILSIEEQVAIEMRTKEAQKRFRTSPKGKKMYSIYESSLKGQTKNKKYRDSLKGKNTSKRYRLNKRLKEISTFLALNPEKEQELRPFIVDTESRLDTLQEE